MLSKGDRVKFDCLSGHGKGLTGVYQGADSDGDPSVKLDTVDGIHASGCCYIAFNVVKLDTFKVGDRVTFDCGSFGGATGLTGTYASMDSDDDHKVKLDTDDPFHYSGYCDLATNLRKIQETPVKYTITRDGEIHTTSALFIGGLTADTLDEANRVALQRCLDLQKTLAARIAELQAKVLPKFALGDKVRHGPRPESVEVTGVQRNPDGFAYRVGVGPIQPWVAEQYLHKAGD